MARSRAASDRCSAACRMLASLSNMSKLEAALGSDARSGAPARRARALFTSRTPSGCASGCGSPMPSTSACVAMADGWWRVSPALERGGRRALLYRLGPERFIDRVLLAWARSPAGAADAAWRALARLADALDRAGVPAQGRRLHRARRRQGPGARRGAARRRGGLDRGGFPDRSSGHLGDCGRRGAACACRRMRRP